MLKLSKSGRDTVRRVIDERQRTYRERLGEALAWLDANAKQVRLIFTSRLVRDFMLEPFRGLFDVTGTPTEVQVRQTIVTVSLMNAAMAAVPGSMGYGLVVAIALESYMAYRIARLLGYRVGSVRELMQSVGAAAVTALGTGMIFKEMFAVAYRALAFLPGPGTVTTFFAEYVTTTALGILFWLTFEAIRDLRLDPKDPAEWGRVFAGQVGRSAQITAQTVKHQYGLLRRVLRPRTATIVATRIRAFLTGEVAYHAPVLRGDVFVPVAMAWLLAKETERLDGPMGQLFLEAVRRGVPGLADASTGEMADYLRQLDGESLQGMQNHLKGEMFEHMVAHSENLDGDGVSAALHVDRTVEGSDLVFTDEESGREVWVSLKATENPAYIEAALARYPDTPIMTTDEAAAHFEATGMVVPSGITHAEVVEVTQENFDELLWQLPSHEEVIGGGLTLSAFVGLYPFAVAWGRGAIDVERLQAAVKRVTGQTGLALASRLAFAAALGPVFGWYLLARGAGMVGEGAAALAEADEPSRVSARFHFVPA